MKNLSLKSKLWIVLTVVIVCLGVIFLSVFGYNNSVDYSKGYELTVGLDQQDESLDDVFTVTENYFDEIGVSPVKYSNTSLNDGSYRIYRFNKVVEVDETKLFEKLESVVDNQYVSITVSGNVYTTHNNSNTAGLIWALSISAVLIFLFVLIFGKIYASISTFIVSILSLLTYIAMISLFRIPVINLLGVFCALSFVLSTILTVTVLMKVRELKKLVGNEKTSAFELVDNAVNKTKFVFLLVLAFIVLLSIILLIVGTGYLRFLALHLLVCLISSVVSPFFAVSTIWPFFLGSNEKK